MKMFTAFWVVWNPKTHSVTRTHNSYESAEKEAERLAKSNPNQEFIVMQAIQGRIMEATPPITTHYVDMSKKSLGELLREGR